MENLGYYNGKYDLIENMTVPMNDRGCYFGDGIYEATTGDNHRIFALDDHIERCYNSARLIELNIPYTKQELKDILCELVKKVDSPEQFIYWQFTRGTAPRSHPYPEGATANLWVYLKPFHAIDLTQRIKLISLEDTRFLHCNIKTLNLLNAVMYSQRATEAGCGEAVLHRGDRVTECAHSNVQIIKDGTVITPPADNLILPGITRAHLMNLCKRTGIPAEERVFTMQELMAADEILVTSSTKFCVAASEVDGASVGGRATALVDKLQAGLKAEFEEQCFN